MATWWTGVYRLHSSLCHQYTPVHQYDCGYFQAVSVYVRWPHGGQVCTGDTVLYVISTHLYTNMTVVTSRLSLCMLDGHMVDRWHSSLCHQHTPVHQYDCGYFQPVSVYARWPHGGQVCTGYTVLCVISTHLYTNMTVVTSRLSLCMLDGHMVDRCVQVTHVLYVISTHLYTNMIVVTSRLSLCMLDGHMVDRWHSSLCHQHTPVHQYDCGYFQPVSVYARWPHGGQVTQFSMSSAHTWTPIWLWLLPGCLCVC